MYKNFKDCYVEIIMLNNCEIIGKTPWNYRTFKFFEKIHPCITPLEKTTENKMLCTLCGHIMYNIKKTLVSFKTRRFNILMTLRKFSWKGLFRRYKLVQKTSYNTIIFTTETKIMSCWWVGGKPVVKIIYFCRSTLSAQYYYRIFW